MGKRCFFCKKGPGGEEWAYISRENAYVCQTCFDEKCPTVFRPLPQSEQRCENCLFWGGGEVTTNNCRRCPPKVFHDRLPSGNGGFVTVFSRTADDDWCGEWQQKEKTNG